VDKTSRSPDQVQESLIQAMVGRKVRELRLAQGISSTELAARSGISQGQLSKVETGKATISLRVLDQLSRALGRSVAYFFRGEAEIPRVLGTLATVDGPESRGFGHLAEEVKRRTGGRISLITLSPSQLGHAGAQVELLSQGVIDLFIDELLYYHRFVPAFNIFAVPYAFRDQDHQQAFLAGRYFREEMQDRLLAQGIRFLNSRWNWLRGVEWVLVSKEPVRGPGDIKGRRVRIFDSEILRHYWSAMGARPVVVRWSNVRNALRDGQVDLVPTHKSHVYPLHFCRYAKWVTRLGDVAPVLGLAVNETIYQALPPAVQTGLQEACDSAGEYFSGLISKAERENEQLNIRRFQATYLTVDLLPWRTAAQRIFQQLDDEKVLSRRLWRAVGACLPEAPGVPGPRGA